MIIMSVSGCTADPVSIKIGSDNCHYCKMTIIDNKYGAEIITTKGKIFKYDDPHCLFSEISEGGIDKSKIKDIYFTDFCNGHALIKGQNSFYLKSGLLKAPMNGGIAAFSSHDSLSLLNKQLGGEEVSLNQLIPAK
jgi:copper chaperone NosL